MKKASTWSIAILVLLGVYFGGTWVTSRMAHAQIARFTDRVTRESHGMLRVVETKSTIGFFSSVQDITFSADYPLATALLRNTEPLRFTVHNVIQHGPLPGLRTVGVARTESSIVMDDATRQVIKDALGTDKPVEIAITFGFLGGTTVQIDSPEMNMQFPDESASFKWKGMKSRTEFSRSFDEFVVTAHLPGIYVASKGGSSIEMSKLDVKGKFKSAFKSLYVGDGLVSIDAFDVVRANSPDVSRIKKAAYGFVMSQSGDYYDMSLKVGAEDFQSSQSALKDVHFDFSMKHLHGPTLASMNDYFRGLASELHPRGNAITSTIDAAEANRNETVNQSAPGVDFGRMQADIAALLKHSPEFVLDHLGFATDKGAFKVTARAKCVEVTEDDIQRMDMNRILNKFSATADVNIAQALVDNWPFPSQQGVKQQIQQLEAQGFLKRNGDQLESHLEYTDGKLIANGKAL